MLSFLSWGQYFSFVGITLFIYYLLIALLYYGNEIQSLLKGKPQVFSAQRPSPAPGPLTANVMGGIREATGHHQPHPSLPVREQEEEGPATGTQHTTDAVTKSTPSADDDDAFLEETEELAGRLKSMMERSGIHTSRAELMEKIGKELKIFSSVTDISPFKTGLFSFIQQQASELCDIELEDSDMDAIWNTLHA